MGRVRRPRKVDQVVQENRMSIAVQVAPLGRARLPREADQVVQENRMSIADQVAPLGRADLEVKVDRVVLAGQAPIKQGSLVLGKVARGASRRTARRTANSSRKVIRPVRSQLPLRPRSRTPR